MDGSKPTDFLWSLFLELEFSARRKALFYGLPSERSQALGKARGEDCTIEAGKGLPMLLEQP